MIDFSYNRPLFGVHWDRPSLLKVTTPFPPSSLLYLNGLENGVTFPFSFSRDDSSAAYRTHTVRPHAAKTAKLPFTAPVPLSIISKHFSLLKTVTYGFSGFSFVVKYPLEMQNATVLTLPSEITGTLV